MWLAFCGSVGLVLGVILSIPILIAVLLALMWLISRDWHGNPV